MTLNRPGRFLRGAAMALMALGLEASAPAMFRGDAAHTGVYASAPPTLASTAWTFRTGAKVLSSPVVSEGVLFVGSADHRLYALDAKSGALKWRFQPFDVDGKPARAIARTRASSSVRAMTSAWPGPRSETSTPAPMPARWRSRSSSPASISSRRTRSPSRVGTNAASP